mmetsp:Transcript_23040/g.52801  ORF Transcript_23040/g.52801 Transcript_23040/m.52801 type:complete len:248 (-) Transcript_23040:88-831(-)
MGCSGGKQRPKVKEPVQPQSKGSGAEPEDDQERPCIQAGAEVTTVGGMTGRVVRRTAAEALLRLAEDGEETQWCAIKDIVVLEVTLLGVDGLREEGWIPGKDSTGDPRVTCQLRKHGMASSQTAESPATGEPEPELEGLILSWEKAVDLAGYRPGDSLEVTVMDRASSKGGKGDFFGTATIGSTELCGDAFEGLLQLAAKEGGNHSFKVVFVRIKVKPMPGPAPAGVLTKKAEIVIDSGAAGVGCCC